MGEISIHRTYHEHRDGEEEDCKHGGCDDGWHWCVVCPVKFLRWIDMNHVETAPLVQSKSEFCTIIHTVLFEPGSPLPGLKRGVMVITFANDMHCGSVNLVGKASFAGVVQDNINSLYVGGENPVEIRGPVDNGCHDTYCLATSSVEIVEDGYVLVNKVVPKCTV
jgi:hypothetical protein